MDKNGTTAMFWEAMTGFRDDPVECVLVWMLAAILIGCVGVLGIAIPIAIYTSTVIQPSYDAKHHCKPTGQTEQRQMLCGKTPCTITYELYECDGGERMWR